MLTNYNNLTDFSKVYVYASSRKFYPNEMEELEEKIKDFLVNWTSFSTSYKIEYQRFIVILLEENIAVSTQMLDALSSFILSLEADYKITLLDKVNVCFKQGEFVQYQEMKRFRELIKNKSVSKKTIVFNNFIQTKEEFETVWEIPILESWLSHLIK